MYSKSLLYRSRLVIPINVDKFVEKAQSRGADMLVLDLEDSIPMEEKEEARKKVRSSIEKIKNGNSRIYVRVNSEQDFLFKDVFHSIWQGVSGIVLPKIENKEQIVEVDHWIRVLENERKLPDFSIAISLVVETSTGLKNLDSILSSSKRIDTVTLGTEDYAQDIGMVLNEESNAYLDSARMHIINMANAYNIIPLGMTSSMTDYTHLETFKKVAKISYSIGFQGSSCIHPTQVPILNESYIPDTKQVGHAKEVIQAFEKSLSENRASSSLNGKMIDYPHYNQAKKTLRIYEQANQ